MAIGRPVITTDVPGCRETVINDVNGFIVPCWDAKALAEKCAFYRVTISNKSYGARKYENGPSKV